MNFIIKEYLVNTSLGHVFFILVLSPWLVFIVGMTVDQYITWLWQGSLISLVLPHGLVKWVQYWRTKILGSTHK